MANIKFDQPTGLVTPPGCILTFTGKVVNLLEPDPSVIVLEDIAHGLSNTCRWNGHTKMFYSVAEHSLRVTSKLPDDKKLTGLFHDCEEAYWGDIVRPLKALLSPEIVTKIVEFREMIFAKFEIPPICDAVNAADDAEITWDVRNVVTTANYVGSPPLRIRREWLWMAKNLLAKAGYRL